MEKKTIFIVEQADGKKSIDHILPSGDYMAIDKYKNWLSEMPGCVVNGNVYKLPLVTYTIIEKEFDVESFRKEMTDFVMKYYERAKEVITVGVGQYYASYEWSNSGEAIVYVEMRRPGGITDNGSLMCLLCNKHTRKFRPYGVDGTCRLKRNELMLD